MRTVGRLSLGHSAAPHAALFALAFVLFVAAAHYAEDMEDPEEAMMRSQEGMDMDEGVREKVTIGILQRPEKCAKKVTEGSKVAVELTLSKLIPSESNAGEMEKVEVFAKKQKLIIAGSGRFIEGIESGVIGACPGEKRSLRIPASLGFAEDGNRKLNIPPETELRAIVSIDDVEDPDPYGEDMDDMSPDEDMDEGAGRRGGEGDEEGDGEDDEDESISGPPIAEEDFFHYVPKVTAADLQDAAAKQKNVFVMFYAPWCGHCTAVKPKFAKVARAFRGEASKVAVVAVDATEEEALAEAYSIEGFPTFVLIKNSGNDEAAAPRMYTEARTAVAMVQAVNEAFGLDRLPNGRLSEFAGTVPELNLLVDEWIQGTRSMDALSAALPEGSYYKRVVESIQAHGKEYVAKEKSRLEKMVVSASSSVKPEQLDSMQRRMNILNVFHDERTE